MALDDITRRIERVENRLNQIESHVASVAAELSIVKGTFDDRIRENKSDFKTDINSAKTDAKERVESLRTNIRDDIDSISSSLGTVRKSVEEITTSFNSLYVTQSTANVKVSAHERLVWLSVSGAGAVALYFLQLLLGGKI